MPKQPLAFGVVLATVACTGVRTIEPARFIPQHGPATVSVWTTPKTFTIVSYPQIEGDTLSGLVFDERWVVALKDIVRVEAVVPDPRRTALLVAGTAASAVGVFLISSSGRGGGVAPCGLGLPPGLRGELCGTSP